LVGSRYIELRVKKLLEDKINEDMKLFIEELTKLLKEFDSKIMSNSKIYLNISSLKPANKAKKIVNYAAIASVGAGMNVNAITYQV